MARPEGIDRDRIADLVDTGLRNLWYPIAPSWMVREAPAGFTRLGLHLVAWRNAEGGVHVLEDRCPHRGARLSLGWNRGDRIACWYHGVEVGPDGSVLKVPAVPGGPFSIIGFVTPVDRRSCRVFFWRRRIVQGWQRDAWRFLYRAHFEGLHWNVLEQDRAMLEAMPNNARDREILYQHDAGLMKLRRLWNERARAQLAQRE